MIYDLIYNLIYGVKEHLATHWYAFSNFTWELLGNTNTENPFLNYESL